MLKVTANSDDIPNGHFDMNFSEVLVDLLIPRALEAMKRLLIADLLAVP